MERILEMLLMSLIPSKRQFLDWSLPSRVGYIAFMLTIIGVLLAVGFGIYSVVGSIGVSRDNARILAQLADLSSNYEKSQSELKEELLALNLQRVITPEASALTTPEMIQGLGYPFDVQGKGFVSFFITKHAMSSGKPGMIEFRGNKSKRILRVLKYPNNLLSISIYSPELGIVSRAVQLDANFCYSSLGERCAQVEFAWDLDSPMTELTVMDDRGQRTNR